MGEQQVTIYITVYATSGLIEKVIAVPDDAGKYYRPIVGQKYSGSFRKGVEAFTNYPDALADAKRRVARRIESFQRQIEALNRIAFAEKA